MSHFVLIDGFNLLSRAYFATAYGKEAEQLPKNEEGRYINALRVFFAKLTQLENRLGATHMSVAWDGKRADTKRNQDHSFYKAQREDLPAPLIDQYELAVEILHKLKIHQLQVTGYEADDIIGTFTKHYDKGRTYIYSNDRDLFQLLSPNTDQLFMKKKQELHYTLADFEKDYEITPDQWIDVKALLGDPSDNIPGCPGVGEKSALPLIKQYGSVEELYAKLAYLDPLFKRYKKKLEEGEASVKVSKELVTIEKDIKEVMEVSADDTMLPEEKEFHPEVLKTYGIIK
ncbi:5'-3' exonuclease [Alkalicoccus halolimnae]|uniref:5'-3' exonuclease n=1 Tax=Alkalicoccus halolimnae TaxID=1667239 RepID=A0A5C7FIR9_9BACI|nr:5'-3' exonuclease H3TH domain-containing protein [Alkalicoccus halolimnae]TXF87217.1 flap endonuclease [Alkalicoccus halolimnae]